MMRTGYALIFLIVIALILGSAGLADFAATIESLNEPAIGDNLAPADAIVVLTGGSERMAAGLALLEAHKGKKLFISGVHPKLTLDRLLGAQKIAPELRACCVVLGHMAESTRGNAEETQIWMTLENYHSLYLVTANYHMPRSLMIFRAVLPDIQIIPYPVTPDSVKLEDWWMRSGTTSLLVTEYAKYLVTVLRLRLDAL